MQFAHPKHFYDFEKLTHISYYAVLTPKYLNLDLRILLRTLQRQNSNSNCVYESLKLIISESDKSFREYFFFIILKL